MPVRQSLGDGGTRRQPFDFARVELSKKVPIPALAGKIIHYGWLPTGAFFVCRLATFSNSRE